MSFLSSLLFGISASLDALLVGIGYGLRRVRIRAWQNLFISFIALLGTCISACIGSSLLPLLPPFLGSCIGSLILILLGVYYVTKWIFTLVKNRKLSCKDKGELIEMSAGQPLPQLSAWETLILSMTLSANNIGIGLSASMAGLPLLPSAIATFVCSLIFLLAGNRLGRSHFLQILGCAADPLSGLLLIGLGILQLAF